MERIIKVENVSKEYRLGVLGQTTLREDLTRLGAKLFHREASAREAGAGRINQEGMFMALSNVSFEVAAGEALGIIGHNGAGKSTLLKLITKITQPTSGKIYLNGRVASMIEVGTGFHPELTGRENIYINGAVLGMTRREINQKLDEIIAFSECEQFIDTPVKRYSSGMYLKLGFSVAAHLDAEIIIMDEVLAVGDAAFQNKCIQKMKEISRSGRTIIYVSHHMSTVRSLCTRCLVLNQGELEYDGDVDSAIQHYLFKNGTAADLDFYRKSSRDLTQLHRPYHTHQRARMEYLELFGENLIAMGGALRFLLRWSAEQKITGLCLRAGIWSADGVAAAISFADIPSAKAGENEARFCIDTGRLLPGKYSLELLLVEKDDMGRMVKQDVLRDAIGFEIFAADGSSVYDAYNRDWGYFELPITVE